MMLQQTPMLLLQQQNCSPKCITSRPAARLKAVSTGSNARTSADLMTLVPWAIKNGIQFAKIKPALQPGSGRGLIAISDIQPGDCICNVPVSAALRVFPGCPPALQVPAGVWQQLPWYGQLALTILSEWQQGSASKWADYIKQLPAAVDVPALWRDAELQQLRCGYFIEQVEQQQAEWCALQPQVAPYLSAAGITTDQLHWALSLTRSRAFAAPYTASTLGQLAGWLKLPGQQQQQQQQQQQHVLCPLLDLFNHRGDVQSECEFYSDLRSSSFRVVASQDWSRGQQVFINYGSGSNDALLQLYGFVEEDNADDRYIVRCLPQVLSQQGFTTTSSTAVQDTDLTQVVITRQGLEPAAADLLQQTVSGASGQRPPADAGTKVSYAALSTAVKAALLAAVQQELSALGVDEADSEVLQAFAELPDKQAELATKQADLLKATGRLQQLQGMLEEAQAQGEDQLPGAEGPDGDLQQQQDQQQQLDQQQEQGQQPQEQPPQQAAASATADLLSTLQLCQQLCDRLQAEVEALRVLTERRQELVQQHKQTAVMYRWQKRKLLVAVVGQLC